jgi:hypothetical protein
MNHIDFSTCGTAPAQKRYDVALTLPSGRRHPG